MNDVSGQPEADWPQIRTRPAVTRSLRVATVPPAPRDYVVGRVAGGRFEKSSPLSKG